MLLPKNKQPQESLSSSADGIRVRGRPLRIVRGTLVDNVKHVAPNLSNNESFTERAGCAKNESEWARLKKKKIQCERDEFFTEYGNDRRDGTNDDV